MKMLTEKRLRRQMVGMVDHHFRRMNHPIAPVLPAIAQLAIFACGSRERHIKSSYVVKPRGRERQVTGGEEWYPVRSLAVVRNQV